jgi:diguanylate cyclase (GGDEF)-like protein
VSRPLGIRTKFALAAIVVYVGIGILTFFAYRYAVYRVAEDFGVNLVKKQSLLVMNKTLSLIRREVALSFQLVDSPVLKQWALNEQDERLRTIALQELESYRKSFKDNSFFFIVDRSKNYYFNNSAGEFKGRELRYTLNGANVNDQWYFTTMKNVSDFAMNVDYDNHLKVTKVWINTIVKGENQSKIGLGGTGFELTHFINELVHSREEGLSTILVDADGGIQGHENPDYVRHNSNLRGEMKEIKIYELMSQTEEHSQLNEVFARLTANPSEAEALFLIVEGHSYLAGISRIDDIGWFVISLADVSKVVRITNFVPIFVVTVISLLSMLVILTILINKMILRPLSALNRSSAQIANGNYDVTIQTKTGDELGKLAGSFNHMVQMIKDHMENLEQKVARRTSDLTEMNKLLDRHARTDPLTGLSNRRQILERMEAEISRTTRFKRTFSVLMLDIDRFKNVNDTHGHAAGDFALKKVSEKLRELVRLIDTVGRWGGEEFLLILPETALQGAIIVAENLRKGIEGLEFEFDGVKIPLTVSAGVCQYDLSQSLDECIREADRALYKAKQQGRNRVEYFETTTGRNESRAYKL